MRSRFESHFLSPLILGVLTMVFLVAGTAFGQRTGSTKAQSGGLFPECAKLTPNSTAREIRAAMERVDAIRKLVMSAAPEDALHDPLKVPLADDKLRMPVAKPGSHTLWHEAKYVSDQAPNSDDGSYINGSLGVINGHLFDALPEGVDSTERLRPNREEWSGYISDAVVVVNGGMKMDGYIYDSIVIAAGPIQLSGYIYNSIVITLADDQETPVKLDGYFSDSILLARKAQIGSFRSGALLGRLESEDRRGGVIRPNSTLLQQVMKICAPSDEARRSPEAKVRDAFEPPKATQFVTQLLNSEQDAESEFLADLLAEFQLPNEQVQLLIDVAQTTTSDKRRNSLWHAIRMSRSRIGREYLLDRLVRDQEEDDVESIVEFINSFTNPTIYDAKLLIELYKKSIENDEPASDIDGLLSIEEQVARLATRPWQDLCTDWNQYGRIIFSLDKEQASWNSRRISDQREERAERGQFSVLIWLVKNARNEEHRLRAFRAAMNRGTWVTHDTDQLSRQDVVDALLGSSNLPAFRARVIPIIATYHRPESFLNSEEHETVRAAALRALRNEYRKAMLQGGYNSRGAATEAVAKLSLDDESETVRSVAKDILRMVEASRSKP